MLDILGTGDSRSFHLNSDGIFQVMRSYSLLYYIRWTSFILISIYLIYFKSSRYLYFIKRENIVIQHMFAIKNDLRVQLILFIEQAVLKLSASIVIKITSCFGI